MIGKLTNCLKLAVSFSIFSFQIKNRSKYLRGISEQFINQTIKAKDLLCETLKEK